MPLPAKDVVASPKMTGQGTVPIARSWLLTLLSVGLFALCPPGRPFPWLAWVCMVPMLFQLRQTTAWRGFFFAGIFGWLMWFTSVWWLYAPLHDMLGLPIGGSLLFILIGCGWLALPYALAGAVICRWSRSSGIFGAARDAAIFTTAITWLTPIFQGSIAHTQYRYPIVLQIMELGGTPLLLFLIFWVNALLAEGLVQWKNKQRPHKVFLSAAVILGVLLLYGGIRLQQFDGAMAAAPKENWFTVGAIQPNIPIQVAAERQPSSESAGNDFYSAIQQAHDLFQKHPEVDLFALPENPATFLFNQDAARRQAVGKLITETHRPVMINADAFDAAKAAEGIPERYNVAVLIDTNHNLAGNYAKIERVPMVEYLPGEKTFPWLRQWFPKSQRVLQGASPVVFEIKPNIKVIPLICYEGTGSALTRQFVRKGGNAIVNQVNDSWFLRTPASEIHLALTLFRTVEYRVPLVRVTNSGVGAHIQADGRIVPGSRTDLFKKTETAYPLYVPASRSIYAAIGNWWMLLFLGLVFVSPSRINASSVRKILSTASLLLFVAILFGSVSAKAFTSPSSPYATSQLNVPLNQATNDSINGLLPYYVSQTPVEGSVSSLTDADSANTPAADILVGLDGPTSADFAWDLGDPGHGYMWQLKRFDLWIPASDLTHSGAVVSFAVSSVPDAASFTTIPNSSGSCLPASTTNDYNYLRYDFPDSFVAGTDPTLDKYPVTDFRYLKLSSTGMGSFSPSGVTFTQTRFVEVDAWAIKVIRPPQISLTRNSAGDVTLTWDTISGHTYNVEYKDQLSDPVWSPVSTIVADADSKSVTDNGTSGLQRYYRILVQ